MKRRLSPTKPEIGKPGRNWSRKPVAATVAAKTAPIALTFVNQLSLNVQLEPVAILRFHHPHESPLSHPFHHRQVDAPGSFFLTLITLMMKVNIDTANPATSAIP